MLWMRTPTLASSAPPSDFTVPDWGCGGGNRWKGPPWLRSLAGHRCCATLTHREGCSSSGLPLPCFSVDFSQPSAPLARGVGLETAGGPLPSLGTHSTAVNLGSGPPPSCAPCPHSLGSWDCRLPLKGPRTTAEPSRKAGFSCLMSEDHGSGCQSLITDSSKNGRTATFQILDGTSTLWAL